MPRYNDLDDDLDDIFGPLPEGHVTSTPAPELHKHLDKAIRYEEKCFKCHGRGRFISYSGRDIGPCFTCKGKGKLWYKTSPEVRAKARAANKQKKLDKQAKIAVEAQAWLDANPAEAEWMQRPVTGDFTFHHDMWVALHQYGRLTEKQEAAVRKATAKFNAAVAKKQANEADVMDIGSIWQVLKGTGLKKPAMYFEHFALSAAPDHGQNAGHLYVKSMPGKDYLGKITPGGVFKGRVDDETRKALYDFVATLTSPETIKEIGIADGKETGTCCICGAELTNEDSIEAGIGPICASRF